MTSRQNQCHKQLVRIGAPIVKYERKPFYGETKQTDAALRNAWRSGGGSKQLSESFVTELVATLKRVEDDLNDKDRQLRNLREEMRRKIAKLTERVVALEHGREDEPPEDEQQLWDHDGNR